MKELVLHIGHSKCASSSVQAFLSRNPIIEEQNRFVYYCIMPDGKLVRGSDVTEVARRTPAGFLSSSIDFGEPQAFFSVLRKIKQQGRDESVIVSNEGLANHWMDDASATALDALGVPIRVFMLARPPVDWLNASWWQWGCWTGMTVNEWVERIGPAINFFERLQPWLSLQNLEDIHIADISQGPIRQLRNFLAIARIDKQDETQVNAATSSDLLRFLINNKTALNRSIHNPSVEFELNRAIDPSGGPPPFVLTHHMIEVAIERTRDDHEKLLERMHWTDNVPSPQVVERYLSAASYDDVIDFDWESFLKRELPPGFLRQVNDWLIQKLASTAEAAERFDGARYLELNPDVALAGANPYEHYLRHGMREGRTY